MPKASKSLVLRTSLPTIPTGLRPPSPGLDFGTQAYPGSPPQHPPTPTGVASLAKSAPPSSLPLRLFQTPPTPMAAQKIDITIVVDMLLTGFDSKNLNLHGLIISGLRAYEQ